MTKKFEPTVANVAMTGLLAWLVPGLGHIYTGEKRRGLVLMAVIAVTFWTGVAIGGVQSTVRPRLWLMGQSGAGGHTLATWGLGKWRAKSHPLDSTPSERAGFLAEDVAVIYTGVAGMLNILIIIDALASTDPTYSRPGVRPPPSANPQEGAAT